MDGCEEGATHFFLFTFLFEHSKSLLLWADMSTRQELGGVFPLPLLSAFQYTLQEDLARSLLLYAIHRDSPPLFLCRAAFTSGDSLCSSPFLSCSWLGLSILFPSRGLMQTSTPPWKSHIVLASLVPRFVERELFSKPSPLWLNLSLFSLGETRLWSFLWSNFSQ